jgi:hypothetical protein
MGDEVAIKVGYHIKALFFKLFRKIMKSGN